MNYRVILFSFTLLFSQFAYAKTDLRLNLEVGESYHQIMESNSVISQPKIENSQDILMTMRGSMTYTVLQKENEIYNMDVHYDSLSMSMKVNGHSITYSSEKISDSTDYFSSLLFHLKNKTFQIKINEKGKLLDISNIDDIVDLAIGKLSNLDTNTAKKLESDLKNSFGKRSFKNSFESITAIYPPEPVEIGRQWKSVSEINQNMPVRINNTYKFENETDEYYLITGVGSLISFQPIDGKYNNSTPYSYEMTGVTDSKITVDKESGWIREATIRQTMEGFSVLKSELKNENPNKVEMQFKIKTTYRD